MSLLRPKGNCSTPERIVVFVENLTNHKKIHVSCYKHHKVWMVYAANKVCRHSLGGWRFVFWCIG